MNTKEFNETIDAMCSNFNISRNELEQGAAIPNELPDEEQEKIIRDNQIEISIIPDYYYRDLQEM